VRLGSIAVSGRSVWFEHNKAVGEKLFIPFHHDACGYFSKKDIEEVVARVPQNRRPRMWFISDPGDYLRPIVFNPNAKIWRDHAPDDDD